MKRLGFALFGLALLAFAVLGRSGLAGGQDKGKIPPDSRLTKVKTLNDKDFNFTVPKTKAEWEKRRQELKEQVLVANGLWPMPKKTPLNPVVHGKIMRDGYTVEKVFFESYPGFYVTGNLYRPTNLQAGQKVAGILSPHGHWGNRETPETNGRFYENGKAGVEGQLKEGAEKTEAGAKYPLQARCANLAMLGCVVFHYDMIGYGDSTQINHPMTKKNPKAGFGDPEACLRLQSFMGLQTWDSVRALDFLVSLPEVDPTRIGVTGASGGGTQTFILCAVDDRPAAAFPAVMVSTEMQGGCVCENCELLRVGTGNVELAGLFAPKPLGISAANDWTKNIEKNGYPELKQLYKMYGAEDKVEAKAYLQFGHNYNQVAREMMYNFFNKHLNLGHKTPIVERPFVPVPPKELSVFDDQHPLPKSAKKVQALRDYMTAEQKQQLKAMFPSDAAKLKEFQKVIGPALRAMMVDSLPAAAAVEVTDNKELVSDKGGEQTRSGYLTRKGAGEAVPYKLISPKGANGTVVVWVHPDGIASLEKNGKIVPAAQDLLKQGASILAIDAFGTGAFKDAKLPGVNSTYAGYTWGYNRTLLANRVHDILSAVAFAKKQTGTKKVNLAGFAEAGPWVILARGLCGDAVAKTAADMNQFRFENILSMNDDMMQPGALKYGGMPALTAVCAPHALFLHNTQGVDQQGVIAAAYQSSGQAKNVTQQTKKANMEQAVSYLMQ
jgi:cephalosporin-C deacetylase-like acetyl esterase